MLKGCAAFAHDVSAHCRAGEQQGWEIENRVGPVVPAGHKAMEVPKRLLRPHIKPTLFRKAGRKLVDYKGGRNEKKRRRNYPETDGRRSVMRGGRDPARAKHGGNVEEQNVPKPHGLG